MDIITHALLGAAVAPNKESAVPMAISGIIPDLWNVPPMVEYIVRKRGRYNNQEYWQWIPARYNQLTFWSHSVVPVIVTGVIGVGVFHWTPWLWMPWFLHLLIDIPTHERSRTGMTFYPLSKTQLLGSKNWYEARWMSVLGILGLGSIVWFRFFR